MIEEVTRLAGRCPTCGRQLPDDAPEGLCGSCLLLAGTETLTTVRLKPDSTSGQLKPDSTSGQLNSGSTSGRLEPDSTDDLPTMSSAGGPQAAAHGSGPRLAEGQVWGAYRIGRLLGRGGMGEVYEAEHADSGRRVALKVLRSRLQHTEDRARFLREGQLAASVSHPHTVYIFGSEEISGMPVISMELLPGGTLKDRVVAEGPLSPAEAVAAVLDIIGGLDAAQAAGILHRDIKPSNCFVDRDGTVKVGDFGLSVSTLARDVHHQLATSGFEGTPQFAPPEQLRGEPLDVRADIYAVGATLYYLLTGRPPFEAPELRELFARVTTEVPPSPRTLRREIPPRLAAVVLQCLAKAPSDRPPSYAALADALRPFLPPVDAPAPIGPRFVAMVVDIAILVVPLTVWSLLATDLVSATPERAAVVGLWSALMGAAYFLGLEGLWGASLGKRLFGLRVTALDGARAPFGRIALRTAIYFVLPNLPAIVMFLSGLVTIVTFNHLRSVGGIVLAALLFSTARRFNGWAAIHDRVSGTRVVARSGGHARRMVAAADAPVDRAAVLSGDSRRRYGPFTVSGDAGPTAEGRLLIGFDPVLRRDVWIHVLPPGTPAISESRRDVSRVARLHWLTGRRSGLDSWDAFEALDGGPLSISHASANWDAVKSWLVDLVGELRAAVGDGSLPALQLNRLWLRNDGHLVLLDFPAPGSPQAPDDSAERHDLPPVALLSALGSGALAELDRKHGPASMPLSARTLIDRFAAPEPPDLDEVRERLTVVVAAQEGVRRSRRAIPIALASAPVLVVVIAAALLMPYLVRFLADARNVEIVSGLGMIANPNPRAPRLRDPAIRGAIERYLAGRHGRALADDRFWNTLIMQQFAENLRPVAAGILERHPAVSTGDLAAASEVIAPERERWQRETQVQARGLLRVGGIIVSALTGLVLALGLGASLLSAIAVPGGLVMRQLGYAVIAGDGREIGRGRSLGRALVAWLPVIVWLGYLAASPKIQGFVPAPPEALTGVGLLLAVMTAGIVWTLARPTRGPHDRLARTWVTPR